MEPNKNDMKHCPYCAELIRREAIKCRYCGSMLNRGPRFVQLDGDWRRVNEGKRIAGVCTGIARQLGDTRLVLPLRLFFILTTVFFAGFGLVVYVVLWILMPPPEDHPGERSVRDYPPRRRQTYRDESAPDAREETVPPETGGKAGRDGGAGYDTFEPDEWETVPQSTAPEYKAPEADETAPEREEGRTAPESPGAAPEDRTGGERNDAAPFSMGAAAVLVAIFGALLMVWKGAGIGFAFPHPMPWMGPFHPWGFPAIVNYGTMLTLALIVAGMMYAIMHVHGPHQVPSRVSRTV